MQQSILLLYGITKEILDKLSYKSNLGISLKKNLHYFEKEKVIEELKNMTNWLRKNPNLDEIDIDYRVKSIESITSKFDRYYPDHQYRKVFDDILGLRAICDSYDEILKLDIDEIRIVDMTNGKANDDGYRGVHIYYQKNPSCYPIEIQFNTHFDRQLNDWLHDYVYKKNYPLSIGVKLREEYEKGTIKNLKEFEEVLNNVLHTS
ncbi:MAG: hypothetical protein IJR67_01825 [Acholeplasmatales bacterium]|nr:hypothetical protein [Acholeplasmatales bacterium]